MNLNVNFQKRNNQMIQYSAEFDDLNDISKKSIPFVIYPNVISDNRGSFSEVLKNNSGDLSGILFMKECDWIKQINRSSSSKYTIRGCHAQRAPYCQGKLVEALNEKIYDIITDARPESKSFGVTAIYILDPEKQNKLWVPPGFLHAFIVPECEGNAIFQYFCSNVYNKDSEIGINPLTLLPVIVNTYTQLANDYDLALKKEYNDIFNILNSDDMSISEKDKNGLNYKKWMEEIKNEYNTTNESWWR